MRAYLPAYEFEAPRSLEDALTRLADAPAGWRPFAGGTDLMVLLEAGKLPRNEPLGAKNVAGVHPGNCRGPEEKGQCQRSDKIHTLMDPIRPLITDYRL